MNEVYKFIESLNLKNKIVIAGISGGPDSMCLLDILIKLKDKLNIKIVVAHIHHNLRKESDEEAIFVKNFSEENNLIFEMMKIEDYPNGKFSEEIAREKRYSFFEQLIEKYKSDVLFTAHHADDLIETILMRISRGSTLKGYAGFSKISSDKGYKIAKPLIFIEKKQIIEYLNKNNIKYVIDMSNEKDDYRRNRYRHHILPKLKDEYTDVHKKFLKYNEKIIMASNYIEKQTNEIYNDVIINNEIIINKFKKLDEIIKLSLLEKYLFNNYKEKINLITDKHIDLILNSIYLNNTKLDMPNNKSILVEYEKLKLLDRKVINNYDIEFNDYVELPNSSKIIMDNETKLSSNYVIHLNKSDIIFPLHVRNRRAGDKMIIKNLNHSKKVSDIFTDEKIPKSKRESIPIVTDDAGTIIWIPGIKKSHLDRKNDKNYDIIFKYIIKEEQK